MNELKDKVALITGAASGIGRAAAIRFAEEGAKLVLADIDEKAGAALAAELPAAVFQRCDVSKHEQCSALVELAEKTYGRLDIAFNNAGISDGPIPPGTLDYPLELWDRVIAINLSSVFYCMRAQVRSMLKTGGGSIVNTASIAGQIAFAGVPGYVAAKHGVVGLTKTVAVEYAAQGIRCNAIAPGFVETAMTKDVLGAEQGRQMMAMAVPAGRAGEAREIADLALWLASPRASYVTGALMAADGGFLAR